MNSGLVRFFIFLSSFRTQCSGRFFRRGYRCGSFDASFHTPSFALCAAGHVSGGGGLKIAVLVAEKRRKGGRRYSKDKLERRGFSTGEMNIPRSAPTKFRGTGSANRNDSRQRTH